LCIKPSRRRTSSRSSRWMTRSPCRHRWVGLQRSMRMMMESPSTRRSNRAWSSPSCTWRRRGRTSSFLCVCALIFRRHRGLHISRPSSGSSGIFYTLLSSVFGTRRPLPFCFLDFWMPTLRGVESIGSRLRGLASYWDLRLFLDLLANNLM
jgi:hypothetical protein